MELITKFNDLTIGLSDLITKLKEHKPKKATKPSILCFDVIVELQKSLEEIKPPGLNDVFCYYNAPHGTNQLKKIMKGRFFTMPRDYFLKRPIDEEFLVYSAKDVEDLVEVKNNIVEKIKELLSLVIGELDNEKIISLVYDISKTYSSYGCHHSSQKL